MLDPSSSEEESDEVLEEERRDLLGVSGGSGPSNSSPRALPAASRDSGRQGSGGGAATRPVSPSPSLRSEGKEEQERLQKEEREKRLRLQLYVFIVRCIAYPFNAKQPTDMARRQQKVSLVVSLRSLLRGLFCRRDTCPVGFSLQDHTQSFSPGGGGVSGKGNAAVADRRGLVCIHCCVGFSLKRGGQRRACPFCAPSPEEFYFQELLWWLDPVIVARRRISSTRPVAKSVSVAQQQAFCAWFTDS